MPVPAYVTAKDITDAGHKLDEVDEAFLTTLCLRASRLFDLAAQVTPGYFAPSDGTLTTKVLYGSGSEYLKLPAFVAGSITSVTLPSGFTVPEYDVRGRYLYAHGKRPILSGNTMVSHGWPEDIAVSITAHWGLGGTPDDVIGAVVDTVITWYRSIDPALVVVTQEGNSPGISDALPPRAKMIAQRYAEPSTVMVA